MEHKLLYRMKGPVPEEPYAIPLQSAEVKREGRDLTIVAYSIMVPRALEAAEKLAAEGIEVEVVDPRCLKPLDTETIVRSVSKTGRVLITHEAPVTGGFGGELAAVIAGAKRSITWMHRSGAWPGGTSQSHTTERLNGLRCPRSRISSPRPGRWRWRESSHGNRSHHAQSRYGDGNGHLCRVA
jgi:transketolase C-terminal domain/subunit